MKSKYNNILTTLNKREKSLAWNKQESLWGLEDNILSRSDIKKLSALDMASYIDNFELLAGQGVTLSEATDADYKVINASIEKSGAYYTKLEILQLSRSKSNLVIRIPKNLEVSISYRNPIFSYWANLYFIVGSGAKVTIIDNHVSSSSDYGAGSVNIISDNDVELEYLSIGHNNQSYNFNLRSYPGKMSAHYLYSVGTFANKYYNYNVSGFGLNALSKNFLVTALSFTNRSRSVVNLRNIHLVKDTYGDIKFKGMSWDKASAQVDGLIGIGKRAYNTDSYLQEDVVMGSEMSSIVADPNLEILNNDVSASHGATIGHIDKSSIFYLMSRGLSKEEAEAILAQGFLKSLSKNIKNKHLQKEFNHIWSQ
jgi:Fe-S cluster assembly scaffold protein SufB